MTSPGGVWPSSVGCINEPRTPKPRQELTEDGHHVVIDGRRWRATDPLIPEEIAAVLRKELMQARRSVKAALGSQDDEALTAARAQVQRVKVALGERGTPWWEQDDDARRARWETGLP